MRGLPRGSHGVDNPNWKGGRKRHCGYVMVLRPDHPRADANKGYVFEHVLVVEAALGHVLPPAAVVHHANEVKDDNRNGNLAALQDQGEHSALHARLRVVRAGGNPWTQHLCGGCRTPKAFDQFNASAHWCRECVRVADRTRRGSVSRAEYRPKSALPNEVVRSIRAAVRTGERQVDVAARFGTTRFVVNNIVKGRKYKSIQEVA